MNEPAPAEPREKFLDLLTWIREMRLWPERFSPTDQFLDPSCGTIRDYYSLTPVEKEEALWMPDASKVQSGKLNLERVIAFSQNGYAFVRVRALNEEALGMGVGEKEALLSALAELRRRPLLN